MQISRFVCTSECQGKVSRLCIKENDHTAATLCSLCPHLPSPPPRPIPVRHSDSVTCCISARIISFTCLFVCLRVSVHECLCAKPLIFSSHFRAAAEICSRPPICSSIILCSLLRRTHIWVWLTNYTEHSSISLIHTGTWRKKIHGHTHTQAHTVKTSTCQEQSSVWSKYEWAREGNKAW